MNENQTENKNTNRTENRTGSQNPDKTVRQKIKQNKKKVLLAAALIAALILAVLLIVFKLSSCGDKDTVDTKEATLPAETQDVTEKGGIGEGESAPTDKEEDTSPAGTQEIAYSKIISQSIDAEGNRYIEVENDEGERSVVVIHPAKTDDGQTVATEPTEAPTLPPEPETNPSQLLTYEEYIALSTDDQVAFFNSFEDPLDFFDWYNYVMAVYEQQHQAIVINPGDEVEILDPAETTPAA